MNELRTDIVVIGGGIAGLSIAFEAAKQGIYSIILDDGRHGTTHSATGIIDARIDHLLRDIESVEQTDREIIEWKNCFPHLPHIIKPKRFIMPIGPDTPHSTMAFETLFNFYEKKAVRRFYELPEKHKIINGSMIEKMEPNLRKSYFNSGFLFWLWTVNPDLLMRKVRNEALFSRFSQRLLIEKDIEFSIGRDNIDGVVVKGKEGNKFYIRGYKNHNSLALVNTTGPWIGETLKSLSIKFPIELKLGVQAKFSGHYFQTNSGILAFGGGGKYIICLQGPDYLQVGPTNGPLEGSLQYLKETLGNLLEEKYIIPDPEFLKSGWRVKPKYFIDTDRPVIWHHQDEGFGNLYTAVPGKMALGLLMAREVLSRMYSDGWLKRSITINISKSLSLDGKKPYRNQLKLLFLYVQAHFILGFKLIKKSLIFEN